VIDLAVLTMDPRFGGGGRAQTEAFAAAARSLGRDPKLLFFRHPSLRGRVEGGIPPRFRRLDGGNQLAAAAALAAQAREARSLWVVSPTAPYGHAAVRSGRPYACWLGTSLASEWAARRPGLPRSRRLALRVNAPVLARLERAVVRGATRVFATSAASRRALAAAGGLDERSVAILPIPVDLERFSPLPDDEWRAGVERAPTLVVVGRGGDPRKNVRLALDALPELRARVPAARLRLVGEPPPGPLPAGAEARGEVPSVPEHLRDAALLVIPSLQEGFGIVAAEALAAGVPVLSTPCGGPEELLRASGGGRVLSAFSPSELAEAAAGLVEDVGTLSEMRRRGREHVVREHSPERLRDLLEGVL
jgi:glycosyltransferase involved in cell wall biosynthesis